MDKLRVNTFGASAGFRAGLEKGIYRDEGLEIEHHVTQSSKAQIQELIDGVWDVVHTNADNIYWWNEDNGADLLIVLATPGKPNQDFVVRPEIAQYEDLRGKPIAVDAAESGYATPLRLLLREAGLAEEGRDYSFLQVGATQPRVDAMRDGRAFGAMIGSSQARELAADGFRVLDSINRLYTHYAGTAAVRRQWGEENAELLIRYIRAEVRSALAANGERASAQAHAFAWDGLREMLEMRRDLGMLRGPIDPRRFALDHYYQQAMAGIGV